MRNLLKETKKILKDYGLKISDISWVGCRDFCIDVNQFIMLADVNYDAGYGAPEVAEDLVVVGEYWFLERHEYDGLEWWEYKEIPKKPTRVESVNSLKVYGDMTGWETLASINKLDYPRGEE